MLGDGLALLIGLLALLLIFDLRRRLDRVERLALSGQTEDERRRLRREVQSEHNAASDLDFALPGD
jgi:hypothetical protein